MVNTTGKSIGGVVKMKGFSLTYDTSRHISMESMKKQVDHFISSGVVKEIPVYQNRIGRTKEHMVTSHTERKTQKLVYNKRVPNRYDYGSLPYGY